MRLKTAPALVLCSLLVLGVAAGCGGQQSEETGETEQQEQGAANGGTTEQETGGGGGTAAAGGGASEVQSIRGGVRQVNVEGQSIRLRPREGDEVLSFRVTDRTRIRVDGQEATLADVQPGQRGAIRYQEQGENNIARLVQVRQTAGGGTGG